jgi:hypothetical protein
VIGQFPSTEVVQSGLDCILPRFTSHRQAALSVDPTQLSVPYSRDQKRIFLSADSNDFGVGRYRTRGVVGGTREAVGAY